MPVTELYEESIARVAKDQRRSRHRGFDVSSQLLGAGPCGTVIPAKAGIQNMTENTGFLDPRTPPSRGQARGGDDQVAKFPRFIEKIFFDQRCC